MTTAAIPSHKTNNLLDPSNTQHGQFGPTLPDAQPPPDQHDLTGSPHRQPEKFGPSNGQQVRQQVEKNQQVDLAMLRHAFRGAFYDQTDDGTLEPRPLSCSQIHQLVSAVVRLHDAERCVLGLGENSESQQENTQQELEALSNDQLIELCAAEGISLPPGVKNRLQETAKIRTGKA